MQTPLVAITISLGLGSATFGQARVLITEIIYNPASTETRNQTEWVEIANLATLRVSDDNSFQPAATVRVRRPGS